MFADEGDDTNDQFLMASEHNPNRWILLGQYLSGWHRYIQILPQAGVQLYYDDLDSSSPSPKFETTSGGAKVGGDLDIVGHAFPNANNTYDLGTSGNRWRNVYTNDLNLSNEGGSNEVDGTWGSYTIQEGAEDLFLINKRSGKKYKFNLTEVS